MDVSLLLKKALKRIAINTKAIETLEPDADRAADWPY